MIPMTNQLLALLKLDLIMTGTHTIQPIECPYIITDNWHDAMTKAYTITRRTSHRKQ